MQCILKAGPPYLNSSCTHDRATTRAECGHRRRLAKSICNAAGAKVLPVLRQVKLNLLILQHCICLQDDAAYPMNLELSRCVPTNSNSPVVVRIPAWEAQIGRKRCAVDSYTHLCATAVLDRHLDIVIAPRLRVAGCIPYEFSHEYAVIIHLQLAWR